MKFALIALAATVAANATTADYQQCDSDIVCEEGSKCATVTQSTKTTMKICAPWVDCRSMESSRRSRGVSSRDNENCQSTTPYIINEGLGTYSGYLVTYTAPAVKKNANALIASGVAVASALFAMQ